MIVCIFLPKQDTVVDAGMYDGALGVICAISALKALKISGKLQKLYRPVEVRYYLILFPVHICGDCSHLNLLVKIK